jgi:hypothetical protein
MKLNYQPIIEWARTRGILEQSTAQFQMLKATEEMGEMAGAILRGDRDELIDAIGDQLVVAIIQCAQLGYDVGALTLGCIDFNYDLGGETRTFKQKLSLFLHITVAQGKVSACIAKGKSSEAAFYELFNALFRNCYIWSIDPAYALDSVYTIISKRGGEMRNGVWVKTEDL